MRRPARRRPGPTRADHSRGSSPIPTPRGRFARLGRGHPGDPAWARPALLLLLAATGLLYLWNLSASGYANSFYAAAVQAGSTSWKAWFFGSLDPANFITVDKPPAALWVMGLSARLFGFSSWSLLVPQALEGVAAVALLSATVRRWSGPAAGLLAGAILALTPAAVLMFRFNHPDALLTLLLVAAAYGVTRALEHGSTGWFTLAGTAIGFAFLTKMLQGFLVLPAFALVYLVAAPTSLWRRITQLLAAGLAVVVSAGWWVTAVALWPASSRPYIGGSTNNSVLDLMFGYNGFGRLLGGSSFGAGGGGGASSAAAGSSFGGATGLTRLFGSEMGNEISWLLPAALVALVAGLWLTRRTPRTDRTRAAVLLWGGWLVGTGLVFSYMQGIVHPYYTVVLAPAIAALVAVGGRELWQHRNTTTGRVGLAATTFSAGGWSYVLLPETPAGSRSCDTRSSPALSGRQPLGSFRRAGWARQWPPSPSTACWLASLAPARTPRRPPAACTPAASRVSDRPAPSPPPAASAPAAAAPAAFRRLASHRASAPRRRPATRPGAPSRLPPAPSQPPAVLAAVSMPASTAR